MDSVLVSDTYRIPTRVRYSPNTYQIDMSAGVSNKLTYHIPSDTVSDTYWLVRIRFSHEVGPWDMSRIGIHQSNSVRGQHGPYKAH